MSRLVLGTAKEADPLLLTQLVEMGFDFDASNRALLNTNNTSVEMAINYLFNSPSLQNTVQAHTDNIVNTSNTTTIPNTQSTQNLSVPSTVSSSVPPTSPVQKPNIVTMEDDKEKQKRMQLLLQQKREKEAALARARARISEDKEMRSKKKTTANEASPVIEGKGKQPINTIHSTSTSDNNNSNQQKCTVQIRLSNGAALKNQFLATQTLADISAWIEQQPAYHESMRDKSVTELHDFNLLAQCPRREYVQEEMPLVSLSQAGLSPNGVLIVQPTSNKGVVRKGDGMFPHHHQPNPFGRHRAAHIHEEDDDDDSDSDYHDDDSDQDMEDPNAHDIENMTYEELLELEERIGKVTTGLDAKQMSKLHTYTHNSSEHGDNTSCPVCVSDIADGDILCVLPCSHTYHRDCVFKWLKTNKNCPICKQNVV